MRYIDDLKTIRAYGWTGAILQTLMGSIKDFYHTLEKVTGCVVALLPETENMFPRFLKWDIGALVSKMWGLDFAAPCKLRQG